MAARHNPSTGGSRIQGKLQPYRENLFKKQEEIEKKRENALFDTEQ
jgi:hypothetical protein